MAFSLELSRGPIKLVLHEDIGRFSLYYENPEQSGEYIPLFLDKDPRTSVLSVLQGNQVHRLGESSLFRMSVEQTTAGARFVWLSAALQIQQDFSFFPPDKTSMATGIRIVLTIKNISNNSLKTGARYLFDTYLGEQEETHFQTDTTDTTDTIDEINYETAFTSADDIKYLESYSKEKDVRFRFLNSGNAVTAAEKIICANWKRLNEAPWDYEVSSRRNFNLLPYSINDSAFAVLYSQKTLAAGESYEISSVCGNFTDTVVSTASDTLDKTDTADETERSRKISKMRTLNNLLEELDSKISSDAGITEEELAIYRKILRELQDKQNEEQ
jgi:hypothetical protein